MFHWILAAAVLLTGMNAWSAPRCLDLTKKQAEKAVRLAKISINKGSSLIYVSRKEGGLVKPLGIWYEEIPGRAPHKKVSGTTYRVVVDGRTVDVGLVYMGSSPKHAKAHNLGRLIGCRQAADKPLSIANQTIFSAREEVDTASGQ